MVWDIDLPMCCGLWWGLIPWISSLNDTDFSNDTDLSENKFNTGNKFTRKLKPFEAVETVKIYVDGSQIKSVFQFKRKLSKITKDKKYSPQKPDQACFKAQKVLEVRYFLLGQKGYWRRQRRRFCRMHIENKRFSIFTSVNVSCC